MGTSVEHCTTSSSSYSVKLSDGDVSGDVTDDSDGEIVRRLVRLSRSVQLGFGFSAAGQRPTTIRSVIKGIKQINGYLYIH